MATDIQLLKDHGQRQVQETLLRFGVPDFTARGLAQVELRQWRCSELLAILQKLKGYGPDLRHVASQPQSRRSFFGFEANVETSLQWIKPPLSLIERAAREKRALCVNAAGEFALDPGGYVAISHVWEEGIQADTKNRGILRSTIQQVFATLSSLNVSWIWLDGLAIPGSNQTLTVHEEELKKDVINNLVSIYNNAEYVVIFDALVMHLRSTGLVDTAVCLLCGKWMTRVWTYQEIFMARKALIITATGAVLFLDMVQALRLLSGNQEHLKEVLGNINFKEFEGKIPTDVDSGKFENMYLSFVRLVPVKGKHPSLTALALSCHGRKTSNDIDYARAFFPVLGLTWKTQYSLEEGMHEIYDSQRWYAKRLLLMHGSPRSSYRPGWAPSYLTGLQGQILSPDDPLGEIEWEKRGLRRKWYTYKVKAHHPARKENQLLLDVDDPEKGAVLMGCILSVRERKQSVEGFIDAIKEGFAFILSNSHISFPTSNGLCINAMLVERDREVQDDDEAWVYLTTEVSVIAQPLSQQIHSWCLLHESPIGTSDLSGKAYSRIARMIDNRSQIQAHHGPLLAAIGAANSELIHQLLAAGEDIHRTDDRGWTPLHLAVSKEQASVVEALIQRRAAVNAQDRRGRTPLNIAAEGGNAQLVEMLLAQGADPNIHPFDELSSLNQAIIKHHHHIMKLLLDNGAEATNKDPFGFAPLFMASGDTVSALLLLDHGVDPNLDLVGGSRLLHMAARGGNAGLVQYLLENGAEVDIREGYEDHGNTALYRAVEEQQEETVQILLEHQADPNLVVENSWTCVLLAASIGNYAILQLLLRQGPRRVSHFCLPEHWTALHIASKNGHRLPVKALLEAGWDYTAEDASGSTPAQLALEAGHLSTAQAIADFHLRQLNAGSRVDSP